LPTWLIDRGYVVALREVIARRTSTAGDRELALAWLQAVGEAVTTLPTGQEQDAFFDAYYYSDESQAVLVLLCYRDRRHTQVQGFSFLLDFNPPWDGAVKDIFALLRRDPRSAIREFVDFWHRGEGAPGFQLAPISAVEAKRRVLEAMACNRRQNIRLPADLIASRENFLRFVLPLPDSPDTPSFTVADFDALSQMGTRPEDIRHYRK
jgi:hypothetical protein